MKNIIKTGSGLLIAATMFVACHKDLDRFPPNSTVAEQLYNTEAGYRQVQRLDDRLFQPVILGRRPEEPASY